MSYGVTPQGFATKPLEQIKADVESRLRAQVSPAINLTPESALGQLHQIFCEELAQVWEVQEAEHRAWDPDANEGESQDNVAAITGTLRREARKSTVDVIVTTDQAVNIGAGGLVVSVDGNESARFANVDPIITAGAGQVQTAFAAEETGPTVANSGTLTEIETPISGVLSVTNPLDADVGADIETHEQLRLRREQELGAVGSGTLDAIRARLLRVPGVEEAEVFENVLDREDNFGRPPHSIHPVVVGGESVDVAQAVWDAKGGGIRSYGQVSATAKDESGRDREVHFDRALERDVWVEIDLDVILDDFPAGGEDEIRQAVVDAGDALRLGHDVISERLQSLVFRVSGVYDLTGFRLGFGEHPSGTENLEIGPTEKASFDTSRVSVSISGVQPG